MKERLPQKVFVTSYCFNSCSDFVLQHYVQSWAGEQLVMFKDKNNEGNQIVAADIPRGPSGLKSDIS